MKFYQVTVQHTRPKPGGWKESGGLPTFYLRDDMQGIMSAEHAEKIARHMLTSLAPDMTFSIGIAVSEDFDPALIGA